ncbi:LysR family transcriptional regulator [Saccharomonospora sp. NB11]|uniref:LysR family transcriptional regulator n=1 Tax=Saccharomonospora sp. NB11 TaxID=1642298 RepID=UPI0018D140E1|nr:LysR family transcriptional regulator [Saccharomonospora sp. NB11]
MGIDIGIRHLRAVVAVADAGGYTGAARALHVAQSSMSRTVLEVERQLGVSLFERTTRRVRPTADGEQFLTLARRLLTEFDTAMNHFEGYLAGTRGSVSIAALPSLAATLLPHVLAAFRAAHPDVVVSVLDGLSQDVLDHVARGSADLAVTVATTVPDTLHTQRIAVDRFVCVFPPGHRFAACDELTWADLSGEDFVAFDPTSSIRAYVDRTLSRHDVALGTVTQARNVGAVAGLTASGLGVSAVPGLVLPMMTFADVDSRPLVEPVVERDICLVHDPARPLSRTALALMELLANARSQRLGLPAGARWV